MKARTGAGQWKLDENFDSSLDYSVSILDPDGFPICEVDHDPILAHWSKHYPKLKHWGRGGSKTMRTRPDQEFAANARFIVLADHCFDVLEEALRKLTDVTLAAMGASMTKTPWNEIAKSLQESTNTARAVLAAIEKERSSHETSPNSI